MSVLREDLSIIKKHFWKNLGCSIEVSSLGDSYVNRVYRVETSSAVFVAKFFGEISGFQREARVYHTGSDTIPKLCGEVDGHNLVLLTEWLPLGVASKVATKTEIASLARVISRFHSLQNNTIGDEFDLFSCDTDWPGYLRRTFEHKFQRIRDKLEEPSEIYTYFDRLLDQELHSYCLVNTHRDLRTTNIRIDHAGQFRLIDFESSRGGDAVIDLVKLVRDGFISPTMIKDFVDEYNQNSKSELEMPNLRIYEALENFYAVEWCYRDPAKRQDFLQSSLENLNKLVAGK